MFTGNRTTRVWSDVSLKVVVFFFVFEHILLWIKAAIENAVSGKCCVRASFLFSGNVL